MKKFLVLTGAIILLAGCNGQSPSITSPPTEDTETTVSLSENVTDFDITLEFEQGLLYLESESIYDDEEDYLGNE